MSYRIIYPSGDRDKLYVALVHDYEEHEWDIASSKIFDNEDDAAKHARFLAVKHGLEFKTDGLTQALLD